MWTACCYDCQWIGTRYTDVTTATGEMNTHIMLSPDCGTVAIIDMEEDTI
jgi:hypothetical protein